MTQAVLLTLREHNAAAVAFHGAVAARLGLNVTDLKALDILERTGPRTAGDLATETGLAAASVTALIDRLARKRFVRRYRDPRDRRRVIVELAPLLREQLALEFEPLRRAILARISNYNEAELRVILSFLGEPLRGSSMQRSRAARLVGSPPGGNPNYTPRTPPKSKLP